MKSMATHLRELDQAIAQCDANIADFNVLIDDKRQAIDRDVDEFRTAVHERDRVIEHRARLTTLRDEEAARIPRIGSRGSHRFPEPQPSTERAER